MTLTSFSWFIDPVPDLSWSKRNTAPPFHDQCSWWTNWHQCEYVNSNVSRLSYIKKTNHIEYYCVLIYMTNKMALLRILLLFCCIVAVRTTRPRVTGAIHILYVSMLFFLAGSRSETFKLTKYARFQNQRYQVWTVCLLLFIFSKLIVFIHNCLFCLIPNCDISPEHQYAWNWKDDMVSSGIAKLILLR